MVGMPSLESSIDSLYQTPLEEFVAARNSLVKTLTGDDARRVKQLQKPTTTAWAVNQVHWQARPVYDRLIKSGKKLRTAQIGALSGRSFDVRHAADEHRAAVAQAVAEASRIASEAGVHPNIDEVSRTVEALSLEITPAQAAGRLAKPLQPAGFEALAGLVVTPPDRPRTPQQAASRSTGESESHTSQRTTDDGRARRREAAAAERLKRAALKKAAAAARQKSAALKKAEAAVVRARTAEDRARTEWERLQRDREAAERALEHLRSR
jgi:hypothetical protein